MKYKNAYFIMPLRIHIQIIKLKVENLINFQLDLQKLSNFRRDCELRKCGFQKIFFADHTLENSVFMWN